MRTYLWLLRRSSFARKNYSSVRNLCTHDVKSFNSIPGPKSLPLIGTLWMYLPMLGSYRFDRLHWNGFYNFQKYGPLVREEILPTVRIAWIFKPEDIETMYRCEGRYPQRRSHLALEKYRTDRPDMYNSGGLLPTNGSEWGRLRKIFQRDLSKIPQVRSYLPQSDGVIKTFLNYCEYRRSDIDLLPDLSRLFLELTSLVVFDETLNSFSDAEFQKDSLSSKLIEATATINGLILETDNGPPLWKYFDTPSYKKLCQAHSYIDDTTRNFMNKKKCSIKTSQATSLLDLYLSNTELDTKDVFGMMADMLLAGIDTMSYSGSFALYHLARNPDKQMKLFEEVKTLIPLNAPVTADVLDECPYTKAALKEIFRLNPISVGVGRILAEDAILSGYKVPKGTIAVTQNQVTCRQPEYFPNPNNFIPERWLREAHGQKIDPYLVLPFGHGPRSCIARRLAEQNLQLLIINAVRNYKLLWCGEELDCKSIQINKPDKDVLVKFERRTL